MTSAGPQAVDQPLATLSVPSLVIQAGWLFQVVAGLMVPVW